MSFFLTSSRFVGEQYCNRAKRLLINLAKMSRITNSESINLSDNYAVLLDETLWENPALRATLIKQDEQNVCNIQGLSDKVASLCHLMSERNHAEQNETQLKKKSTLKVHVPSRCWVSLGLNCFFKQLHFVIKNLILRPVFIGSEETTLSATTTKK